MKVSKVVECCREAAEAIASLTPAAQAGWIIYILEKTEETPAWPADRKGVLVQVKRDIETRLEKGRW